MKRPRQSTATFPRLRELREEKLGWDVTELLMKLGGKPSAASIYRMEAGESVRVATARRVFDAINAGMGGKLDPTKEINIKGRR